jgi:hypothetical protein
MLQSRLSRFAGPFALAAGFVFVVAQILLLVTLDVTSKQATVAKPVFVWSQAAYFVGFCILLLALVAAYDWESQKAGALGIIGFCAAIVGTMFLAGDLWFDAFAGPWIITAAPEAANSPTGTVVIGAFASYVLFAVGWVLFGLASLRARVFPAPISLAITVGGGVGFLALMPPYGIPLGLAIAALGVWMIRTTVPTTVPSAVAT